MKRPGVRREPKAGPPPGTYRNGIDLTQIRYLLSLTPRQRLEHLQQAAASLAELRASAKR
jgi:hypothetical protein